MPVNLSQTKYVHTEQIHNLHGPRRLIPHILAFVSPSSVLDLGCGTGTFLKCFKDAGITDVLGVDGDWVDRQLLHQNLSESEFLAVDLERPFKLRREFDLALCLEVAEHLRTEVADQLVANLVNSAEVILFSAALPGQGGQNHVNEQWPTFWEAQFNGHGYRFVDLIRPRIWRDKDIEFWYRQNTFLAVPEGHPLLVNTASSLRDVVHPDLFTNKINSLHEASDMLRRLNNGIESPVRYLKLFVKALLRRVGLYRS